MRRRRRSQRTATRVRPARRPTSASRICGRVRDRGNSRTLHPAGRMAGQVSSTTVWATRLKCPLIANKRSATRITATSSPEAIEDLGPRTATALIIVVFLIASCPKRYYHHDESLTLYLRLERRFMDKGNLSRRGFLQQSLLGMAAAGLPLWYARQALAFDQEVALDRTKKIGPNDRIQIGVIGSGDRFKGGLFHDVKRHKPFVIVACCDVDKQHVNQVADKAQKEYKNEVARTSDFRELCARKDIDAVVVATPDHWHALAAIEAMKNKKDVYCEKPLTLTINEGKAMVKVARANDIVFQTGSQQRSDARFRLACELVRNGRLGKIRTIETAHWRKPSGWTVSTGRAAIGIRLRILARPDAAGTVLQAALPL